VRKTRLVASLAVPVVLGTTLLGTTATPAGACGGLIGENGTIELVKTTTLAAYNDGIERYMTAFEFNGQGEEVGSIIPLPDEPTKVEKGGNWTLQRLVEEVTPPPDGPAVLAAEDSAAGKSAEVILETEVDALDITVLRGGGDAVGEWAAENGFLLTPDAPEVLDFYADRSPYFMAAKFDASRAAELGQGAGDSTPVMATIPTDDPWVPLRILGLGLEPDQQVQADVFLLTKGEPQLLAGGPGIQRVNNEAASELLLDDLRSDERMEWVPEEAWLTYLQVDSPAGQLDFDLAASTSSGTRPNLEDTGVPPIENVPVYDAGGGIAVWPLVAGVGFGLALLLYGSRRFPADSGPGALAG
jgi:hypothetical protein